MKLKVNYSRAKKFTVSMVAIHIGCYVVITGQYLKWFNFKHWALGIFVCVWALSGIVVLGMAYLCATDQIEIP